MKHLLLFLIFTNSFGQYKFNPKPHDFDQLNNYIEIEKVIDARSQKDIYLYSNDSTQVLNVGPDLEILLLNFLKESTLKSNKPIKLFIKLNAIQFGLRKIEDYNLVSIYCDVDVYKKVESGFQLVNNYTDCIEGKAKFGINQLINTIN